MFETPNASRTLRGEHIVQDSAVFFASVYYWMACGLALTGLTAWQVANTPSILSVIYGNRLAFYALIGCQLLLVWQLTARLAQLSTMAASICFLTYAFLNGVTLASIFLIYTDVSIASTFFIAGGSFVILGAFGRTTKANLQPMAQFLLYAVIGLILAGLVNLFFQNSMLQFLVSVAGVFVFAGLLAVDHQKIKHMYLASGDVGNLTILAALILYLDFINLFLYLLRLVGRQRD